jgi:hypothetical protein
MIPSTPAERSRSAVAAFLDGPGVDRQVCRVGRVEDVGGPRVVGVECHALHVTGRLDGRLGHGVGAAEEGAVGVRVGPPYLAEGRVVERRDDDASGVLAGHVQSFGRETALLEFEVEGYRGGEGRHHLGETGDARAGVEDIEAGEFLGRERLDPSSGVGHAVHRGVVDDHDIVRGAAHVHLHAVGDTGGPPDRGNGVLGVDGGEPAVGDALSHLRRSVPDCTPGRRRRPDTSRPGPVRRVRRRPPGS